jgi:hypothetical protein
MYVKYLLESLATMLIRCMEVRSLQRGPTSAEERRAAAAAAAAAGLRSIFLNLCYFLENYITSNN